jgi:hypothetical protein
MRLVYVPAFIGVLLISAGEAHADGTLLSDDTWNYQPGGALAVDAGLVLALPAALSTGMAIGAGGGVRSGMWGARVEGLTSTESSRVWTVTDRELRVRGTATIDTTAGRATIGLRLALGGNLVHEARDRNQGARAGAMGDALRTTALALLPAADLALALELHIAGHWLFELAGGPTIDLVSSDAHFGWTSELGVAWRP